ncbi:hypothetical protein KJ966_00700 [bacterium]|nr:hypothetical protein [bacterium]
MTVKVIVTRKYPKELEATIIPFLSDLYQQVTRHGGYISGETLICVNDPEEHLIISTWKSMEDWEKYCNCMVVNEIRNKIDSVIGELTLRRVYQT